MSSILLPLHSVELGSWETLIADWGHGKATPRYIYSIDCTVEKFPDHKVLRGPHPSGTGFTDSGFLVDALGQIVGGVDAIGAQRSSG